MTYDSESLKRNKDIKRTKLIAYRGGICAKCGINLTAENAQFHHPDSSKKSFNISTCLGRSLDLLVVEVEKCILLCTHCHSVESGSTLKTTHKNQDSADLKGKRQKLIDFLGGKCVYCGRIDHLQIDHIDPLTKLFDISNNLYLQYEILLEEAKKCQLLCISCHSRKTAKNRRLNSKQIHGTVSCYTNLKCRCEECKNAAKEDSIRRKNNYAENGIPFYSRLKHGTHSCWVNAHCRCNECYNAHYAYRRDLYFRKQQHGTLQNYNLGCDCDNCKLAKEVFDPNNLTVRFGEQMNGLTAGDQVHTNDRPL